MISIKKSIGKIYVIGIILSFTADMQAQEVLQIPLPSPEQLVWHEAELGVLVSYDLHVFDGKKYNQQQNRITPIPDINIFNPEQLDTDQWIRTAKAAGAKFAVLTATHETGFALYQSDVNPYCMKALKYREGKADIVEDFVNSCRKYDILPCIYVGIRWNSFLGVHDFRIEGESQFVKNRQIAYKKMCEGMVEELCTRYGELFMIWFDGGADDPSEYGADVLPIVQKYQPKCLFYHNSQRADFRWGGSETGTVPYPCWSTYPFPYSHSTNKDVVFADNFKLLKHGDNNGNYWMPAMSDAPLRGYNGRHEWFWEPGDEAHIQPLEILLDMYYKSVGRNSTLILGLTPNPAGLMPEADKKRLAELGIETHRRFYKPINTTNGQDTKLVLKIKKDTKINHIVLKEEISKGERVRLYIIEAFINSKWQEVARGECIGQKRIQKIEVIETLKIRLRIPSSIGDPHIKEFSAYWIE
ncbi:MAG: glycoside hydrolase family 29 [Bacteroidetes bacterium]|nr:MAG: glycoside hydrolase family 29 [Bacteroidota bacterium]